MSAGWKEALSVLYENGWETDDIDAACEALFEACDEGAYSGQPIAELSADQVESVLDVEVDDEESHALALLADLRVQSGSAAEALARALYDLDRFFGEAAE